MNTWTVLKSFYDEKLPDRYELYSSLKDKCTSERDYLHAINVWNVFKMNAVGGYHDLRLKTDVLLLADVFEKFINTCLEYYKLDPCHYLSNPGLSLDAMLNMTEIELKLISDIEVYLFIEKGMRGGISHIGKRFSRAHLNTNNNEFKWLKQKEIDIFDVNSIGETSSIE